MVGAHFAAPGAAGHGFVGGHAGAGFAPGNGYWHGGHYWGGGYWHGVFWPHVWFNPGFAWFLPILPLGYATFWWGGVPYYYWNNVYYTWDPGYNGYVVNDPPPAAGQNADTTADSADAGGSYTQDFNLLADDAVAAMREAQRNLVLQQLFGKGAAQVLGLHQLS